MTEFPLLHNTVNTKQVIRTPWFIFHLWSYLHSVLQIVCKSNKESLKAISALGVILSPLLVIFLTNIFEEWY